MKLGFQKKKILVGLLNLVLLGAIVWIGYLKMFIPLVILGFKSKRFISL